MNKGIVISYNSSYKLLKYHVKLAIHTFDIFLLIELHKNSENVVMVGNENNCTSCFLLLFPFLLNFSIYTL